MDSFGDLACFDFYWYTVAKQLINFLIVVVQISVVVIGLMMQNIQRSVDLCAGITILFSQSVSRPSSMLLLPARSVQSPR